MTAPRWICPVCGQSFVSPKAPHSCAVAPLDEHFARSAPQVRAAFDALLAAAREHGPVTVNSTKSRITLQAEMRFAAVDRPRRAHFTGHLVLTHAAPNPAVTRIDFLAPYYHLHRFRLERPEDVDDDLRALLAAAYAVGARQRLRGRAR